MLLRRIWVVLLCALIAGSTIVYTATFRFFDRPLTKAKQEEFQEQIVLPDNFTLAASVNSFDTVKNTLQSVRQNVHSGSYALELNVTYNAQGVPYLADGPEYLTSASVPLETVFKEFQNSTYLRYILRMQNHTKEHSLIDLAVKYNLISSIMLIGFTPEDFLTYCEQYANFIICFEVDANVNLSNRDACIGMLQEYADYGASGITINLSDVTDAFLDAMIEIGSLRLIVDQVNSKYDMYHALSMNPNIVITENPENLYELMLSQDYLDLNNSNSF